MDKNVAAGARPGDEVVAGRGCGEEREARCERTAVARDQVDITSLEILSFVGERKKEQIVWPRGAVQN